VGHADVLPTIARRAVSPNDGAGVTVEGTVVLVRKKSATPSPPSYQYYEDLISSASIDVAVAGQRL